MFTSILMTAIDLALTGLDRVTKVHLAQGRKPGAQEIFEPHPALIVADGYFDPAYHEPDSIVRTKNGAVPQEPHRQIGVASNSVFKGNSAGQNIFDTAASWWSRAG